MPGRANILRLAATPTKAEVLLASFSVATPLPVRWELDSRKFAAVRALDTVEP